MKHKLESRLPGKKNISNLRYADTTTLGRKQGRIKEPLDEKEGSEKVGLKLNIRKTKIMAFGPITSWQIDGEQWKQRKNLFSWAPESLKPRN